MAIMRGKNNLREGSERISHSLTLLLRTAHILLDVEPILHKELSLFQLHDLCFPYILIALILFKNDEFQST